MVRKTLSWVNFGILAFVVLVAPWIFGAWEMWWFWSFTLVILLATAVFGVRLFAEGLSDERFLGDLDKDGSENTKFKLACLFCFVPFLLYAVIRVCGADVYMDAEKSFLLHLTGFLIGVQIVFGFSRRQMQLLFILIAADFLLLGSYGLINHFITGNKVVMWADGFEKYWVDNRTTGSYYCPDHFAGIMELAVCVCFGFLLSRRVGLSLKIGSGILLLISFAGIVLSQSRGAGISIVFVVGACLVFGFFQWPRMVRWSCRLAASAALLLLFLTFCIVCDTYVDRFVSYFGWEEMKDKPLEVQREMLVRQLDRTSRGRMIGAALRGWRSEPLLGIGPGMHQNLWPHFAATSDGDVESGERPRMMNNNFHSYEVHSDWVQLLEEYGLVGFLLFLIPALMVLYVMVRELYCERSDFDKDEWVGDHARSHHAAVLAGILAWICMAVHSLGDFNLQMPATVWLFAGMMAIPIGLSEGKQEQEEND